MKKRIFINMHYMEVGGAERALLGLLSAIDASCYDVDLFLNQHTGEFMSLIPDTVNLLPEVAEYTCIERPLIDVVKEGHWGVALRRLLARRRIGKYLNTLSPSELSNDISVFQYVARAVDGALPSLERLGEYDLAISFMQPHNIVLNKVRAKRKVAWIHTDYSTVHVNRDMELPVWNGYDNIVSISDDVTKAFLATFPSLKRKIVKIENILSSSAVRAQAVSADVQAEMPALADGFRLLTIGRYSYQKNYDNLPFICRRILDNGVNVKWYIIGFGASDEYIREKIRKAGLEDNVVLLGKRANPYPYIQACDVYVQPSRYEGKAVTVREAQILCKPVVITDFPTANSQLVNGTDGLIVPMDNNGAGDAIAKFLSDEDMRERIVSYEREHDYGNETEVEKLYSLL